MDKRVIGCGMWGVGAGDTRGWAVDAKKAGQVGLGVLGEREEEDWGGVTG